MTSPNPTPNTGPFSGNFSPALLALKRFVRGTLKQTGIAVMSLVIFLSIHVPGSSADMAADSAFFSQSHSATQANSNRQMPSGSSDASPEIVNHRSPSQAHLATAPNYRHTVTHSISARMTHHHLTRARLSVSSASDQATVSVAGAQ